MISSTKDKIYIERKELVKNQTWLLLLIPFGFALADVLGLNSILKLIMDGLWFCLVLHPFSQGQLQIHHKLIPFAALVLIFLLDVLIVYLFRFQSLFYLMWGLRNNFRFYVFFFAVASLFTENDGTKCLDVFDRLFWINAVVFLIQFSLGFRQDFLGGVFGVSIGCNGYLSAYFCVVISKSVLSYMNGTEKTMSCFFKCFAALVFSAMAEVKFFFFAFALILVMSMVLTSFSFKKVALFSLCTVLLLITTAYLGTLYKSFEGFFSFDTLLNAVVQSNYASENDMGRFSALRIISNTFLKDTPSKLFGLGLGNCDSSSFSFFHTPFFETYENSHYYYFSHAMMFLENGYVGLVLYATFFVFSFIVAIVNLKKNCGVTLFCQMAVILSMLCLILLVYNAALRVESGFMIYFVLALPFIEPDDQNKNLEEEIVCAQNI